jgi:succinyl-diaminopimelate desuccinylase
MTGAVELLQKLIQFRSVSPSDAGSIEWMKDILQSLGFECLNIDGTDNITKNLYASIGKGEKNLCFAGHLDVVPSGPETKWIHPPFSGTIKDGIVHGRGAVDMKGAIASYLFTVMRFLKENKPFSKISFLIV